MTLPTWRVDKRPELGQAENVSKRTSILLGFFLAVVACSSSGDRPAEKQSAVTPPAAKKPRGAPTTELEYPPIEGVAQHAANPAGTEEDEAAVYAEVKKRTGLLNVCYERERELDPELEGKMVVEIVVGPAPEGPVTASRLVESTIDNSTMQTCVMKRLQGFKFTRSTQPLLTVRLSLLFH